MAGENRGSPNIYADPFAEARSKWALIPFRRSRPDHPVQRGKQVMSSDALPPTFHASRSLTSFVEELDSYDPKDCLLEGHEETNGYEPEIVAKFLQCLRGFLTSARARIIEAQLPTVKAQLAVLSEPIQRLNDQIFLFKRVDKRTPEELRSYLSSEIKRLLECREQIADLAAELDAEYQRKAGK
jgi:hypothetical protein